MVLTAWEAPATNSDEAITGLVALHIARGEAAPAYFYGQDYMGALEAYLAAPLFAAFGPGVAALRVPLLLVYALFLLAMFFVARRLYSPGVAAATVVVLSFGADRVLKSELIAGGGYPEITLFAAVLFLLAGRRSIPAAAGFGLVAGLSVWSDPLVLPYVGAAGLVMLAVIWRSPVRLLALGAGLLAGAAPMIAANLGDTDTLAVVLTMSGEGGPLPDRLHSAIVVGIPLATGLCDPGRCAPEVLWWGPVYLGLLVASAWLAVRSARADRVRGLLRAALVVAAVLTVLAYARSAAAAAEPLSNARYLHCLLVSTPAVLWPLACALRRGWAVRLPAVALALAMTVAMASATVSGARFVSGERAVVAVRADLVAALDARGIDRVHSEYWTCHWLTFATAERIQCAVVGDELGDGSDRHPRWRRSVEADPAAPYLMPVGHPLDRRLAGALGAGWTVDDSIPGFRLYTPA